MEPDRDPDRTRRTFRALAIAAGVWFIATGVWGMLTETPADRATSGCEAAATQRAGDSSALVGHTLSREEQGGWFVAGEVRKTIDNTPTVTHRWECTADAEGRNPAITGWVES